nr:coatomer subunit delta [Hymenolepis microstoma]
MPPLVSRQFVEMSKSRIEGLIATFPKLADPGKQHTFVETDSVRYVYQPIERLIVLLITTKASNILEDLETLRLFARLIPEYARGSEASDIIENAFQIIFAFDEIVALGYRESVTLSQIRTFTEMDSHEEKMFNAVRENQMQEARELSKRKARELQLARQAAAKQGLPPSSIYNSFSSGRNAADYFASSGTSVEPSVDDYSAPLLSSSREPEAPTRGRGMQLGGGRGSQMKSEMDKLTDMLRSEVPASALLVTSSKAELVDTPAVSMHNLHVRLEERLTAQAFRDGGVDSFEVSGILHVRAADERSTTARIRVDLSGATSGSEQRPSSSFQTHPNVDKPTFQSTNWLAIKPGGKAFLVDKEVAVLKWRAQTTNEAALPIVINCWPSDITGGFEVIVEHTLQDKSLSLQNLCITIPLPSSLKPPVVSKCDGDYEVDSHRGQIRWTRPFVDADNDIGTLEFVIRTDKNSKADQFFPVSVDFSSTQSYCGVAITEATDENGEPIKFSTEVNFHSERYTIV